MANQPKNFFSSLRPINTFRSPAKNLPNTPRALAITLAFLAATVGLVGARPAQQPPAAAAPISSPAHHQDLRQLVASQTPPSDAQPAGPTANQPLELLHETSTLSLAADASIAQVVNVSTAVSTGHLMWMEVTAYCGCKKCCGPAARGLTASGRSISYNGGLFIAADTSLLPFGTLVQIPGYSNGEPVEVIDRGSAIKGHHIDVFFPTHEQAKAWGRRRIAVNVLD